ncbi:MAG: RidA family protein [Halieaceae bacterium]|nr:RidA family protein [Halieaceae bacterium]
MSQDAVRIKTQPDPYEPFNISQGFRVGDLVFVSGQAALTLEGEIVGVDDFDAQAQQAFQNLADVLAAAGSSLEQVVKVTIYLTDMSYFERVVALRERFFTPPWPADTLVEVSALALPELMIEIDATAMVNGQTMPRS